MATQPTPVRKRDLVKGFLQDIPRSLSAFRKGPSPSTTATRPGTPDASLRRQSSNVDLNTAAKTEVAGQKAFVKSESFKEDMARLYASYVMEISSSLKEVVTLMASIKAHDNKGELDDILETCARFVVGLASAPEDEHVEAEQALEELKRTMDRVRKAQLGIGDDAIAAGSLGPMIEGEIARIKPAFIANAREKPLEGLAKVLDVTIGGAVSVLKLVASASSLIPVPLIQPVLAQVVTMIEAVEQTRSNYNDMKDIASRAGEFAVSCAVICSESPSVPSERLQHAIDHLTREVTDIARDCGVLSRQGLLQRYLKQNSQASDLETIRNRLDGTIAAFQTKLNLSVKLDTEVIIKKLDSAALEDLPAHHNIPPNEYFKNSRDDALEYVSDWVTNGRESILWIYGSAGLGKSTVARQIIDILRYNDHLAGGILLTYEVKAHPAEVVRMIAKQLGKKHPRTVGAIAEAAGKLGPHDSLKDYLTTHIIDPVRALKYPYQLVVVIDALDEWSDRESFLKELGHIPVPSPVKFILTSRFSHAIERILSNALVQKYPLPPTSQTILKQYFHHHFTSDDIDWKGRRPDAHKIQRLATLADGLLIWAATVRALVSSKSDGRFPHVILDDILNSGEKTTPGRSDEQLKVLYCNALSRPLFPPNFQDRLRDFLGAVLVLQEPLPFPDFACLVRDHIPEITLEDMHRKLAALRIRGEPDCLDVLPAGQVYHASFIQFIQDGIAGADSARSSVQKVNAADAHLIMGKLCLEIVFKRFLPSFRGRTGNHSDLNSWERYAVKFWPLHLASGTAHDSPAVKASLADVSSASLHKWTDLFLPCIAPRSLDSDHDLKEDAPLFELLYNLGMLIGPDDDGGFFSQLYCFELSVRLEPGDGQLWKALGDAYATFYEKGGNNHNLEQQIISYCQALHFYHSSHPLRPSLLNKLANALSTRLQQQGTSSDISEAISLYKEAIDLLPADHPNYLSCLNNLASTLVTRFEQHGDAEDLSNAISLHREALELHPATYHHRSILLNNLANALQTRFQQKGNSEDLCEALSLYREVLSLRPSPHPDRPSSLNNLALALVNLFQQQGAPEALTEAIILHREALGLRSPPHPDCPSSLNNLANALHVRFLQQADPADLNEAISLHKQALGLRSPLHPDRSMSLNNLASVLRARFEQQGDPADLSEAISLNREALDFYHAHHPIRPSSLENLAHALMSRFQQQGTFTDLSQAIALYKEALHLRPLLHPHHFSSLNNLANALRSRFQKLGDPVDLAEAISLNREALELCTKPHPDRWMSLVNLADCLRLYWQFKEKGAINTLQEASLLYKEAISLSTPASPRYPLLLRGLLAGLELYFEATSNVETLDESIMLYQQLIDHPSVTSEQQSWALKGLILALRERYKFNGDSKDLDDANKAKECLASKEFKLESG